MTADKLIALFLLYLIFFSMGVVLAWAVWTYEPPCSCTKEGEDGD